MSPKTIASVGQACAHAVVKESRGIRFSGEAPARASATIFASSMRLYAVGAFLHHAAHAHRHVRIFLASSSVGRAFGGQWRKVFFKDVQCADELFSFRRVAWCNRNN